VSIESSVDAANPVELIVMLYGGAILYYNIAVPYVKNIDFKSMVVALYKAIRIIQSGLKMSFDHQVGGEIAINLNALHTYMTNQLVKTNIENLEVATHEVVKLLTELRGHGIRLIKQML
jgi:flagellar protein FliS